MRKMSQKNLRVNAEVARELSAIIRELKDPRIALMTSVTDAYVAPDLKTCRVYISVLNSDEVRDETMAGLNSARGFIRRDLASRICGIHPNLHLLKTALLSGVLRCHAGLMKCLKMTGVLPMIRMNLKRML